MNLRNFKMFTDKGFQDANDAYGSEKVSVREQVQFLLRNSAWAAECSVYCPLSGSVFGRNVVDLFYEDPGEHVVVILKAKCWSYLQRQNNGIKMYMKGHKKFHERLRKTLYYGKYSDGTLPSFVATDVAVRLINSKTSDKKSLDKRQAARITRRARISPCALMMGILYTERLAQSNPNYLKKVSSSDLFMVSMLVASKYLYDDGEDDDVYNYDWCKAGNYHIRDLNRLEREFLNSIEWRIFVSRKEFFEFVNKVETRIALDRGKERGWYSYLDMSTLLENLAFQELLINCLKSTGKSILGYTLAYSLSVALLLCTPTYLLNEDVYQGTSIAISIPSMSFTGQFGHSEYSLKMSQSIRKRQRKTQGHILDSKNTDLKVSKTTESSTGISIVDTCDRCDSCSIVLDQKESNGCSFKTPACPMVSNELPVNGRNNEVMVDGFHRVVSFVKLAFHNRSLFHESVRFPVWENSYSDVLIGFSTSSAAAA